MIPLTLLRRFGPPILAGLAVIALLIWIDHRGYSRAAEKYQASIDLLQTQIAAKTAEAEASDLRHARDVEKARGQISNEVSHDYQKRLAALRARYDELRSSPEGLARCGEFPAVPGFPDTPGGSDAAAQSAGLPCPAALTATEQAMQLEALQRWLSEQTKVAP